MFLTVGVLAQGNVLFQSKNANPAVNFKILNPDGTVAAANLYTVGLWGGLTADSLAPLKSGGVDITTPLTLASGYFAGGSKGVDGIAAGVDAFFQVRVWETGKTYDTSMWFGAGNVVTLKLTAPPSTPQALVGMTDVTLTQIPEPSVLALSLLGMGAFLMRRRS